jgi:CRP/FNR family transcriptional regulator, cyclic AMP receptor protein
VSAEQVAAQASAALASVLSSPTEIVALIAAAAAGGLTITSSFVKTMVPLRLLALCSNCGFLAYGVLHPSWVMALMHGVLLPINAVRLGDMLRLTRRVRAASGRNDKSGLWLRPYMKSQQCKAGDVLFVKGALAEHLYVLADGRIEFVEIGASIGPGQMFGEIAFFAPDRRRTLTARCSEDSVVLSINQHTVRELYYQNPAFGFEIVGLIAARLSADVERLQKQLKAPETAA